MKPLVFALPGNEELTGSICAQLEAEAGELEVHRFPDGESRVRIVTPVEGRSVAFVCTLHEPDPKIAPLLFAAGTAKELGAGRVGLVAPYLSYMRQDKRFHDGEAITSVQFGKLLSAWFDWLVTVDPHLHRHAALREVYSIPDRTLHAAPLISQWIQGNIREPVLVGPDAESEQWVSAVAKGAGAPFLVLEKTRRGDRDVEVSVPEVEKYLGRTPVLVDDIISTAHTMIETVGHLKHVGLLPPVCIGVHAVFASGGYAELKASTVERIVTCNSIAHETNAIDLSALIAGGVKELL
ncbi:MAG: ribose-phosphate pyrophosphokinase [Chrysiogenetes bacterium]|nr:ribose-phosphate pyrophosphokinase [Chrysiogenetes bacterium]